jgi:hypothetical protein
MIGKKTKGGFMITSSPLRPELVSSVKREPLAVSEGEGEGDSDGDSDGDGEVGGVGVGDPWRVKLAHGFGCTLAHRRCGPGASPGNGFTVLVKLPPPSAVTLAATWPPVSQ